MRPIDADALPKYDGHALSAAEVAGAVELAPTIDPEPHWIPCSERLPLYGEKCLVDFKLMSGIDHHISVSYCYVQKEGFWSDTPFQYKAIAWMPLPEPYGGEQE